MLIFMVYCLGLDKKVVVWVDFPYSSSSSAAPPVFVPEVSDNRDLSPFPSIFYYTLTDYGLYFVAIVENKSIKVWAKGQSNE